MADLPGALRTCNRLGPEESREPLADRQILAGIDRYVLTAHFEMQVWPSRTAGGADLGDRRARIDHLALFDEERAEMPVAGDQARGVRDLDKIAVAGPLADEGDLAVTGAEDRGALG